MYICVEGCIGIGKSTVATLLSREISGHLLLEDADSNPFLSDFYSNIDLFTFETELSFLLMHYHQLYKAMHESHSLIISDYFFDREKSVFADGNISCENEMLIFNLLYDNLRNRLILPDAIVCLSAPTDMIFERITSRNRASEWEISRDYVDMINNQYKGFFSELRSKFFTIDINMEEYDFVKNPNLITSVSAQLKEHLKF